ncbi:hypothetical protein ABS755_08060 [Castellaniella sp. FW104-16D08]|uniref:hypothetical protein n=1 Tax=unclassified Castellaniella TaxID=2617606 RepID=UPI003315AC15
MAEKEQTVTLVAVERGFLHGALVEPGTTFTHPADAKPPKWAAKQGDSRLIKAAKPITAADLKPQAAQKAVKAKAAALTGDGSDLV